MLTLVAVGLCAFAVGRLIPRAAGEKRCGARRSYYKGSYDGKTYTTVSSPCKEAPDPRCQAGHCTYHCRHELYCKSHCVREIDSLSAFG